MSEMIEKVARAMYEKLRAELTPEKVNDWESVKAEGSYHMAARAAVEAMREPTRAMRDAGQNPCWTPLSPTYDDDAAVGGMWRAMIDAALATKATP
jgi:hypothetical protein